MIEATQWPSAFDAAAIIEAAFLIGYHTEWPTGPRLQATGPALLVNAGLAGYK